MSSPLFVAARLLPPEPPGAAHAIRGIPMQRTLIAPGFFGTGARGCALRWQEKASRHGRSVCQREHPGGHFLMPQRIVAGSVGALDVRPLVLRTRATRTAMNIRATEHAHHGVLVRRHMWGLSPRSSR